jgi:hypothetical protein
MDRESRVGVIGGVVNSQPVRRQETDGLTSPISTVRIKARSQTVELSDASPQTVRHGEHPMSGDSRPARKSVLSSNDHPVRHTEEISPSTAKKKDRSSEKAFH